MSSHDSPTDSSGSNSSSTAPAASASQSTAQAASKASNASRTPKAAPKSKKAVAEKKAAPKKRPAASAPAEAAAISAATDSQHGGDVHDTGHCTLVDRTSLPVGAALLAEDSSELPSAAAPKQRRTQPTESREDNTAAFGLSQQGQGPHSGAFEPSMKALQGVWRHSLGLGLFEVRGHIAKFHSGLTFRITERPDGGLEAIGWVCYRERSTFDAIMWTSEGNSCIWYVQDEVVEDGHVTATAEACDAQKPAAGKRKRAQIDYQAMERELQAKETATAGASSAGAPPAGRSVSSTSECDEVQETKHEYEPGDTDSQKVQEARRLFETWMLSTRSEAYKEKLRQRGALSTLLTLSMTDISQRRFAKELHNDYGAKVTHGGEGSVVIVDEAARNRFSWKHPDLWRTAPLSDSLANGVEQQGRRQTSRPEKVTAIMPTMSLPELASTPAVVARAANVAPEPAPVPTPTPAVVSQDARPLMAAAQAPLRSGTSTVTDVASAAAPSATASAAPPSSALASAPSVPSVESRTLASVNEAKNLLTADPPPDAKEADAILTFLSKQNIDAGIIAATKIGFFVNSCRKIYKGDSVVVAKAMELVSRWKAIYYQHTTQADGRQALPKHTATTRPV